MLSALLCHGSLVAQSGPVSGTIVSGTIVSGSGVPLDNVAVTVEGTARTTITDQTGRFRIDDLRGTDVVLGFRRIGFAPATRATHVGETGIRVVLTEVPVNLNEMVVTGTAGATERRAIGNAVSKVGAADLQAIAPVSNVGGLLQSQAAGVHLMQGSGAVTSGSRVVIRGLTSLSLSGEPLLYVDGVRVDNSGREGPGRNNYTGQSRFNDLNPDEIESIEIIKGPAAATLYGTEASNGVIQVITKRGGRGDARLNVSTTQGVNFVPDPEGRWRTFYRRNADGTIFSFNPVQSMTALGTPIFSTGRRQDYETDVGGGTGAVRYFVAGGYQQNQGVIAPNQLQRKTLRTNVDATLSPRLSIAANVGYLTGRTDFNMEAQGSVPGILDFAWRPTMTPDAFADPTRPPGLSRRLTPAEERNTWFGFENLDRLTGGATVTHTPTSWLTHRVTLGTDVTDNEMHDLIPYQSNPTIRSIVGAKALGWHWIDRTATHTTTMDYSATGTAEVRTAIRAQTSVGAQYNKQFTEFNSVRGEQFPGPGVTAVNSAAVRVAEERFDETITLGMYVQEQLAFDNRLFLTGALRGDDNSAFGKSFRFVTYPKASAAWVLSEEPFWRWKAVNTFRLRGAFGQAGKQPLNLTALSTFQGIAAPGGVSGARPSAPGNPNLGPERGSEIEGGFEAAMYEGRVGVDLNLYRRTTNNAILQRPLAPSLGFETDQYVNIGQILNKGMELRLSGVPVTNNTLRLQLGLTAAANIGEITDMGGIPNVVVFNQEDRKGYAPASFFGPVVVSTTVNVDPTTKVITASNVMCDGGTGADGARRGGSPVPCSRAPNLYLGTAQPKFTGAFTSELALPGRVRLYGQVDFIAGVSQFPYADLGPCQTRAMCAINVVPDSALAHPLLFGQYSFSNFGAGVVVDGSYARLRQLSAAYELPARMAALISAANASVVVSARNLWIVWSRGYPGLDPDINNYRNGPVTPGPTGRDYSTFQPTPQSRQLSVSVRATF